MRKAVAGLVVIGAMVFASPAAAQNGSFCFHRGGDAHVTDQEAKDQARLCLMETRWWCNGAYLVIVRRINSTAVRVGMRGPCLHPNVLVDWDPANGSNPAGYWISVY